MEIMLSSFEKCAGVSEWSIRKPPQFTETPKFTKKIQNNKNYKKINKIINLHKIVVSLAVFS